MKQSVGGEDTATYAENFCKCWQAVINTPGRARDRYSEVFGSAPTTASGVRFVVKYEQVAELATATPDKIMNIIKRFIKHGVSEASSMSMMATFNPDTEAQAALAIAIVETVVVAKGVNPFLTDAILLREMLATSYELFLSLSVYKTILTMGTAPQVWKVWLIRPCH